MTTTEIQDKISKGKKGQLWTDFLVTDSIDYKEINLDNGRIEIIRAPSLLNPFRANGQIILNVADINDGKTLLKCEILPFNGYFPIFIGLLIGGLILWTDFMVNACLTVQSWH